MDRRIKRISIVAVFILAAATSIYITKDTLWAIYKGGLNQAEAGSRYDSLFTAHPGYMADGFDYPVGKPDAKGYYDAQPFTKNNHLGEDWNGTGGGNTDLGDPVYAAANGYVSYAKSAGPGWGNVMRIVHCIKGSPNKYVETLYGHVQTMLLAEGQWVKRGDKIATIGNANGAYYAHLHFELRRLIDMNIGPGYSTDTTGYLNPKVFIKKNRPKP